LYYLTRGTTYGVQSLGNMLCETKVSNFDVVVITLGSQQQVLWLQVTMSDTVGVEEVQSLQEYGYQVASFLLTVMLEFNDAIKELSAFHDLSNERILIVILIELIQTHDIWVVDLLQDTNLFEQGIHISSIRNVSLLHNLDCEFSGGIVLACSSVYLRKSTLAQLVSSENIYIMTQLLC
jgi:hypothetical protein